MSAQDKDRTVGKDRIVGLEALEPAPDPGELSETLETDPESDSPGDESILEQEEQYLGISSPSLPSDRAAGGRGSAETGGKP